MISKREPGISSDVSLTKATGVEPSSSPTRQRVGASDLSGIGSEVGALQGAAGREIALSRRSDEHCAHAGKLRRPSAAEMGREPPLQDGVGERFNSAALDLGDALVPDVVGSDLRCSVAEHERRDALRILTVKLLRDETSDRQSDDRRASNGPRVQKAHEVARVVGDVVLVRPRLGQPVAALVVSEDTKIGRENSRQPRSRSGSRSRAN